MSQRELGSTVIPTTLKCPECMDAILYSEDDGDFFCNSSDAGKHLNGTRDAATVTTACTWSPPSFPEASERDRRINEELAYWLGG